MLRSVGVIGAGPAGIGAALELERLGVESIVLYERGRHQGKRSCPVDAGRSCHGCGGVCNVIRGFGGSIHYGDGLKLSKFPSGRRLQDRLGNAAEVIMNDALSFLSTTNRHSFRLGAKSYGDLQLKQYEVAELSGTEVNEIIHQLYEKIARCRTCTLRLGTDIESIETNKSTGFLVHSMQGGKPATFECAKVIVATGRAGEAWWRKQVTKLGVSVRPAVASVGLRFELPPGFLDPLYNAHPDFKTSIEMHGTKVKTFCLSAGAGGGRVKFSDYGNHVLLDGHVISDRQPISQNLAILVQLRNRFGTAYPRDWIEDSLLPAYRSLRPLSPGKPVIQRLSEFRVATLSHANTDEIFQAAGFLPMVRDYEPANIAGLLPQHIHQSFCDGLDCLISSMGVDRELFDNKCVVLGLELEGLWDEVITGQNLESSVPGLYVAGDCLGLAQGVVQSAASGIAAARACAAALSLVPKI